MTWKRYKMQSLTVKARVLTNPNFIITSYGIVHGDAGDYHVIGADNEHYIMSKTLFENHVTRSSRHKIETCRRVEAK